jgi:hypothetical protein
MAYNQNIPQAGDQISVSQNDILNNFMAIYNSFNLNHVPFNSGSPTAGKHAFVEMPIQTSAPMTIAGEVGLYCQTSPITGDPALVFLNASNGPAFEFTTCGPRVTSNAQIAWLRLASGILIQWGFANANGSTNVIVPINDINGFLAPTYNNPPRCFITTIASSIPDSFVTLQNVATVTGTTTLTVYGSARTSTASQNVLFNYMLIGI